MTLCALILATAFTRTELIERLKTPPRTMVSGLVQVVADCPSDMRHTYQGPVARFAADICQTLYLADRRQPAAFSEPGISIFLGSGRTNDTRVVVHPEVHDSGKPYTRLYLPCPGATDIDALRLEIVRAYYLSVHNETIDTEAARQALRRADPALAADDKYERIARWLRGEPVEESDEDMLKLCRMVIVPGVAREYDVLHFASRLWLYPETFDQPFCGKYPCLSFREAIRHLKEDPRLRLQAYRKAPLMVAYGGGRGPELYAAAQAYSELLFDIARDEKTEEELLDQLEEADIKLNIALEQARLRAGGVK